MNNINKLNEDTSNSFLLYIFIFVTALVIIYIESRVWSTCNNFYYNTDFSEKTDKELFLSLNRNLEINILPRSLILLAISTFISFIILIKFIFYEHTKRRIMTIVITCLFLSTSSMIINYLFIFDFKQYCLEDYCKSSQICRKI